MGRWLAVNGEAVYNARPWRIPAEGPTVEVEGQFSDASATAYTREDFRFTAGHGCIYAACLQYPEDGQVTIRALARSADANKPNFHGILRDVEILGFDEKPSFSIDREGLHIQTKAVRSAFPVVIKIRVE